MRRLSMTLLLLSIVSCASFREPSKTVLKAERDVLQTAQDIEIVERKLSNSKSAAEYKQTAEIALEKLKNAKQRQEETNKEIVEVVYEDQGFLGFLKRQKLILSIALGTVLGVVIGMRKLLFK